MDHMLNNDQSKIRQRTGINEHDPNFRDFAVPTSAFTLTEGDTELAPEYFQTMTKLDAFAEDVTNKRIDAIQLKVRERCFCEAKDVFMFVLNPDSTSACERCLWRNQQYCNDFKNKGDAEICPRRSSFVGYSIATGTVEGKLVCLPYCGMR